MQRTRLAGAANPDEGARALARPLLPRVHICTVTRRPARGSAGLRPSRGVSTVHEGAFLKPRPSPWAQRTGIPAVLERWRANPGVARCLALDHEVPSRQASYAPMPEALAPGVRAALEKRGISQLYAHQAEAFALATAGRSVVVATPTASRQEPLLQPAGARPARARAGRARALPLPDQGALARSGRGAARAARRGRARARRDHLRRRHARRRAARGARAQRDRCSRTRTCCTPASCRITRAGRGCSRTCATS